MNEYEFAGFRLNVLKRQLSNAKREVLELPARAFDALVFLVEHRGEDIGKEQIMKAVWPNTIVEENNLNQAIFALRRALGDSANEPRFIMTLPGRGYRFIGELTTVRPRRTATRASIAVLGIVTLCAMVALWWLFWPTGRLTTPRCQSPCCHLSLCYRIRVIRRWSWA